MPVHSHNRDPATSPGANQICQIATLTAGCTMIVASNRGPVEFYHVANGRLSPKRGVGAWSRHWLRLHVMCR